MIELHGWLTIRNHYDGSDEFDDNSVINELMEKIKTKINENLFDDKMIQLDFHNGSLCLSMTLYTNHFGGACQNVFSLIRYISDIAPGSYGLVYLYDDEDENGHENTFQVFVLAKGRLTKHQDTFLSPLNPKVEDY